MENIDYPKFKPEKITKPIQLLAVWFVGLIFIDGLFIFTSTKIEEVVLEYFLVIASILNVPLFLYLLFKLQTKFRAELQEDSFYFKYLDRNSKIKEKEELESRVESRNEIEKQFETIDSKIDNLTKGLKEKGLNHDFNDIKEGYEKVIRIFSHNLIQTLASTRHGAEYISREIKKPNFSIDKIQSISENINNNIQYSYIALDELNYQFNDKVYPSENISINNDIIFPILNVFKSIASHKKLQIKLELKENIQLVGDKRALKMAFYNILENSIKYSPQSNDIIINTISNKDNVSISVKNKSVGLDNNEIKNIFKKNYRGQNSKNADGLGIGLYVANKIINNHKGSINASINNDMYTVTVLIPLKHE